MKIIGKSAFSYTLIESICIPSHVSHIKKYAFSYCKNLKTVEFSMNSELDSIDDYAFSNTLIESISIPQSVSFIGQYVFYSEKSTLKTVEFIENSNLKFLSNKAFANTSIESIAIPEEFAGIRNGIFCYTPNLVDIKILYK